jgi:hypothetical protein
MNRPTTSSPFVINNYLEDLPIDLQKNIMSMTGDDFKSWKNYKSIHKWSEVKTMTKEDYTRIGIDKLVKFAPLLNASYGTYEQTPTLNYRYSFKYNIDEGRIYMGEFFKHLNYMPIYQGNLPETNKGSVKKKKNTQQLPTPDFIKKMMDDDDRAYREAKMDARVKGIKFEEPPEIDWDKMIEEYYDKQENNKTEAEEVIGVSIIFEDLIKRPNDEKVVYSFKEEVSPAKYIDPETLSNAKKWAEKGDQRSKELLEGYGKEVKQMKPVRADVNTLYIRYVVKKSDTEAMKNFNRLFPSL